MAGSTGNKLFKVASQINIGRDAIVEYLASKGHKLENKATTALTDEQLDLVIEKFAKELKSAQKQREKVQRQQAVRKSHLEQGNAISIETIAEAEERERVIEERLERPEAAAPVQAEVPAVEIEEAAPVSAAPVAVEQPEPVVAEQPIAEQSETAVPAGPQVGVVIDLSEAKKKEAADKAAKAGEAKAGKNYEPTSAKPKAAPTAPVAETPAAEATPAEGTAEGASEDGDEKKGKRRRKGVVEVEYNPSGTTQLRGLTVVGKIDLAPKAPPRPKRDERRPDQRDGRRGAIGDALAARGRGPAGSAPS
ncbi:MAG: hypothetical protein ACKOE4_00025, partial [Candidatus Kapaibacterium sp.]